MRSLLALLVGLAALMAVPVRAQVLSVETYMEQWDPVAQQWVRVTEVEGPGEATPGQFSAGETGSTAERFLPAHDAIRPPAIAAYGPFRVHDDARASLVGVTGAATPGQFAAMLRDFPHIATLEMIECPGTDDDRANMKLGRLIRAAGIATHVPPGGSVRSGAVELFLAGALRLIDDGAEFAVHAWLDDNGRQPHHFAADSPENRLYLDYYMEMGMSRADARAFYDMTNSAAHDDAIWLTAHDMRAWTGGAKPNNAVAANGMNATVPAIAYLDLGDRLP